MRRTSANPGQQSLLSLLEEGTHLLRRTPSAAWLVYVLTTLPFLLFFFFFLNDMSRSARAASHVKEYALLLSLAYGLMKTGQALHAERLMAVMEGKGKLDKMPFRGWVRMVSSQLMIHATAPVVLILSAVTLVPLPWTYAFYHSVTILAAGHFRAGGRTGALVHLAWEQAHYQWGVNSLLLAVLKLVTLLVYMNVFAAFALGATLLKSVSGVENLFTMHWELYFSSPLQGFLFCLCYLAMNPFVKSLYVLRCFYGASRTTGADLAVRLRTLTKASAALASIFLCSAGSLTAAIDPSQPPPAASGRGEELAESIHDVLQRSEYQWRMPRGGEAAEAESSLVGGAFRDLASWIGATLDSVGDALGDLIDWLFGTQGDPSGPVIAGSNSAWLALMPKLLWVLLIVLVLGAAWIFFRHWKQVKKTAVAEALDAPAEVINLENEQVVASQLPENEWLRLAREKMDSGEMRLAVRALFLATLAHLGEKRLLLISKTKSNGDYLREISLRARGQAELNSSFSQQVRTFDRVWYGWHEVTEDLMVRFQEQHERITSHAP